MAWINATQKFFAGEMMWFNGLEFVIVSCGEGGRSCFVTSFAVSQCHHGLT